MTPSSWLDRLLPRQVLNGPAARKRGARVLATVTIPLVGLAIAFIIKGTWHQAWSQNAVVGSALFLAAVPLGSLRYGASLRQAAWFLSAVLLTLFFMLSVLPTGTHVWSIAWAAAVPGLVGAIAGSRTMRGVVPLTMAVQTGALVIYYFAPGADPWMDGQLFGLELMDALGLTLLVTATGQAADRGRDLAVSEVAEVNAALGAEVEEHLATQERLATTRDELVQSARVAGMAEVATGVLHNVGNALNSVNTSATLVSRRLNSRKLAEGLRRTTMRLRDHSSTLDADQREQLARYIEILLGGQTALETDIGQELARLNNQVEHVATIISVQQELAGPSGLMSEFELSELVEQAQLAAFGGEVPAGVHVDVVDEVSVPIVGDRHQLLQVLCNLLTNARDEVNQMHDGARQLRIHMRRSGTGKVQVEVSDSGRGVCELDRERVFQHGFTTKSTGHGFGLHSSALAAQSMGGHLRLADTGPLSGATFVLEVPTGV